MSVRIRLLKSLYERILADLQRPHPFASERIGFLFARMGTAANDTHLIFLLDYIPVPDDQYLPTTDFKIGAEISSEAIRDTMQRAMNTGEGAFHAHLHEHLGRPRFSRVDMKDLPLLARSFQRASPASAHGGFLFSKDDCMAAVWLPGHSDPVTAEKITVIGYPLQFHGGERYVGR
ncbi:MAG TPA: hypothetical protein VNG51_24940 [Ktedonobacteraceae bacterium]|nr:hypothetical protein [Ktedonobacteraceae bacterium]